MNWMKVSIEYENDAQIPNRLFNQFPGNDTTTAPQTLHILMGNQCWMEIDQIEIISIDMQFDTSFFNESPRQTL